MAPKWPASSRRSLRVHSRALETRCNRVGTAKRDDISWVHRVDSAHTVQDTILPDADRARVSRLDGMLNSMLLIELVDRAEKGKPLLPGIERLYAQARRELPGIVSRQ